jgi:hypothetical protein
MKQWFVSDCTVHKILAHIHCAAIIYIAVTNPAL